MSGIEDMPRELAERFLALFTEVNGQSEVNDMAEFIRFIAEHGKQFPFLLTLVNVNEAAVIKHYEETGEVPPGVRLIGTSTPEGSNVTYLEILQGPIPPKK